MPPFNRYQDGEITTHHRRRSISPTGSCLSLSELEDDHFKFARQKSTKSVSFATSCKIEYIERHCEWSEEERICRWYSHKDYANFRKDLYSTLYMIRNHAEVLDDIKYTARGVECRDPAHIGRRQQVKQNAWAAVFEEQNTQRSLNGNHTYQDGSHWIATLYSQAARPALLEALDFAAMDELEVSKYATEEKQVDVEDELFSDDWITCISSISRPVAASEGQFGFAVFGDTSGFDDDWLEGDC